MIAYIFNPCTLEAEAGGFTSSRPSWPIEFQDSQVPRHTVKSYLKKRKNKSYLWLSTVTKLYNPIYKRLEGRHQVSVICLLVLSQSFSV